MENEHPTRATRWRKVGRDAISLFPDPVGKAGSGSLLGGSIAVSYSAAGSVRCGDVEATFLGEILSCYSAGEGVVSGFLTTQPSSGLIDIHYVYAGALNL